MTAEILQTNFANYVLFGTGVLLAVEFLKSSEHRKSAFEPVVRAPRGTFTQHRKHFEEISIAMRHAGQPLIISCIRIYNLRK
jgi:hypothetical protein